MIFQESTVRVSHSRLLSALLIHSHVKDISDTYFINSVKIGHVFTKHKGKVREGGCLFKKQHLLAASVAVVLRRGHLLAATD